MVILSLLGLVLVAITYGIFFLIFKLIWMLFKSKRNIWPLVLAGVTTLLLILGIVLAAVRTYQSFIRPFTPIVQAIEKQTSPITGSRLFTTKDWSMRIFEGMTFSDKIEWGNMTAYIGTDINSLLKNTPSNVSDFLLLGVVKYESDKRISTEEVHQQTLYMLQQDGRIKIEQTAYSADGEILYVQGQGYTRKGIIHFMLLNTLHGEDIYYVSGLSSVMLPRLQQSLESFQLKD